MLKKHFKTYSGIAIALVSLVLFSACEKEEDFIATPLPIAAQDNISSSTYRYANATEVPEVFKAFTTAFTAAKSTSFDHVTIDQGQVTELNSISGEKTYSTLLTVPNTSAYEFYNLVVKTDEEGALGEPFVVKYVTDKKAHEITAEDHNTLNWQIETYKAKDFFGSEVNVIASKSSSGCPPIDIQPNTPDRVGGFSAKGDLSGYFTKGTPLPRRTFRGSGPNNVIGTVTICVTRTKKVRYQCDGPNSDTDHPGGPNGGGTGDNRCGDASSGYSGTGHKLVTSQTCIDVNVAAKPRYVNTFIDGTVIYDATDVYFNGQYSLCQLETIYNGLVENEANLTSGGIRLRDRINSTLGLSLGGGFCTNAIGKSVAQAKGKNAIGPGEDNPNIAIGGLEIGCPDADGIAITTPSEIHNLIKALKTLSIEYFAILSPAQEQWLLDPKNQKEAREIADLVDNRQGSAASKKAAVEIIKAAIDGTLVSIKPFVKYPKGQLGKDYLRDYPKLTEFLKNDLINLKDDPIIINALKTYGSLTEDEIKKGLTWGSGPTIKYTYLSSIHSILGRFNGLPKDHPEGTEGPDVLEINAFTAEEMEEYLKKNNDFKSQTLKFFFAIVILHEYTHYGDFHFNGNMLNSNGEPGYEFETEVFGTTLDYPENLGLAQKYLLRNKE
ncbi:hypothetical protein [Aquimarina algiphila]|uniref:hypothetical protein n=1 Tax=Aquimarina algiphila TaxID=2047982 RepID=UPI00232BAF54|nr:hypothetical protein [Aquimarina algiphila]